MTLGAPPHGPPAKVHVYAAPHCQLRDDEVECDAMNVRFWRDEPAFVVIFHPAALAHDRGAPISVYSCPYCGTTSP